MWQNRLLTFNAKQYLYLIQAPFNSLLRHPLKHSKSTPKPAPATRPLYYSLNTTILPQFHTSSNSPATDPSSECLTRQNKHHSLLAFLTFIYLHHQKRKHHFQTGNVSLHIYSGPTLATSSLLCKLLRSYQPEKRSTKLQVPVIHLTSKVSESQSRHHSRMVNNPSWTPILAVNQNPCKKTMLFVLFWTNDTKLPTSTPCVQLHLDFVLWIGRKEKKAKNFYVT